MYWTGSWSANLRTRFRRVGLPGRVCPSVRPSVGLSSPCSGGRLRFLESPNAKCFAAAAAVVVGTVTNPRCLCCMRSASAPLRWRPSISCRGSFTICLSVCLHSGSSLRGVVDRLYLSPLYTLSNNTLSLLSPQSSLATPRRSSRTTLHSVKPSGCLCLCRAELRL